MRLVLKWKNYHNNEQLLALCKVANNLYNQALYLVLTTLEHEHKWLFYNDLNKLMQVIPNLDGEVNYRLLKAQVAQQCLKLLEKNVKSYIKSVKDWSKNPSKYKGKPKMPQYRKKGGYNILVYPNQSCTIREGRLFFSRELSIPIPQWEEMKDKLSSFQQVRVLPHADGTTTIEVVYVTEDVHQNTELDYNNVASMDLGVSNLVTLVMSGQRPLIYSGAQLKSKNRWYNKEVAQRKSELEKVNGKKSCKRLNALWEQRSRQFEDVLHKVSRHIVNVLTQNKVGKLVIGYNEGWKDSIHIGRANNQTFVMLPHRRLIQMLLYKCQMCGIECMCSEESYTSKCDALAMEEVCKHEEYVGKRVKRGLFQSAVGQLVNADVNGALNIMRKVVGDSESVMRIIDSGLLFRPLKFNNLYELNY